MNMSSLLLLLFFFFFGCSVAQTPDPVTNSCNDNIIASSQALRNIQTLLPKLVSGTVRNGYIATSQGAGGDRIYGLAQCRGDVDAENCSSCINYAARSIRNRCPNQADARVWYDYCFLRYSNVDFIGQLDTSGWLLWNVQNVTDSETFNRRLGDLMREVSSQAVRPGNRGLGKGRTDLSPFVVLYALAQCTRDLSDLSCAQCVSSAVGNFGGICRDRRGCRILYSSCYVRYELYPFYFPLDRPTSGFNSVRNYNFVSASKN